MSAFTAVAAGMRGALLLARGRPEGLLLIDNDRIAAIRSFWSIPLCLPALVGLKLVAWAAIGPPANAQLVLGRYLLLFIVGWLLFVLVSHRFAAALGKQALWPRFIAAWGYCSVVGNTLVAVGELPDFLGVPRVVGQVCDLVTFGWALWLEWYAIRLSLSLSRVIAAILLLVDVIIGLAMALLIAAMGSSLVAACIRIVASIFLPK